MTATEQFFQSVREVFANPVDWTLTGLVAGVSSLFAAVLSLWLRRRRTHRALTERIDAVVESARLVDADLEYLGQIAADAGLQPVEVMTSLAAFEQATAAALARETLPLRAVAGSAFDRIGQLRRSLGFAPLAPHAWMLSSRELLLGDRVAMGSASGPVVEVDEAIFAVDLPADAAPALGTTCTLVIDRAEDSPYLLRVRVRAVEPARRTETEPGMEISVRRTYFTHDEQPERHQHRQHVRVRLHDPVTVRIGAMPPGPPCAGTLVDVSAGGLALDLPTPPEGPLRQGMHIWCGFSLGPEPPFELAAIVVATTVPRAGLQHLRVSFSSISEPVRDRLAAAVIKVQGPSRDRQP